MDPYLYARLENEILRSEIRNTTALPIELRAALILNSPSPCFNSPYFPIYCGYPYPCYPVLPYPWRGGGCRPYW